MSAKPRPRSSSRLRTTAPSSSEVDERTLATRQCSTISPSRTAPKWVCVLPTSTTRSTRGLCAFLVRQRESRARAAHALIERQRRERVGEALARGRRQLEVEFEQRDQDEAPR